MTKILYIPESGFLWFILPGERDTSTQNFEDSNIYFMPFEKDEDIINLLVQYSERGRSDFNKLVKEELEVVRD